MATPNLGIVHMTVSQATKEDTFNNGLDRVDESANDTVDIVCTAGGTIVVTSAQFLDNQELRLTGTPAGAFNLDVPDGKRDFKVNNTSGQTATVDTVTGGASTIAVLDGERRNILSRGTDLEDYGGSIVAAGRQSEWIPAAAMQPSVTKGCSTLQVVEGTAGRANVHVRDFDSGGAVTLEEAQFQFAFPNRWDKGTITFKAYYTHVGGQTAGLDGVAWGLAAISIVDDAAWDIALGTEIVVTLDRADADDVHVTAESAAVTVGGTLGDGNMCFFVFRRKTDDAADDLNIDARLLGIRIFWTQDSGLED